MFAVYTPEPEYVIYATPRYYHPFAQHRVYTSNFYAPDSIYNAISNRQNACRQARLQFAREQAYQQWLIDQKRKHEALKQSYIRRTAANTRQSNPLANNCKNHRHVAIQVYSKQEAAKRIVNFLERRNTIYRTRVVLQKLSYLRKIQTQLQVLKNQYQSLAFSLIFRTEHARKVLPISENNKLFLKYEDAISNLLDLLDRIETKGVDVVRKRRKEVVNLAQEMLGELDQIKEAQWKAFASTNHQSEEQNSTKENNETFSANPDDLSDYHHVEAPSVNVETVPVKVTTDVLSDNQHEKSNDDDELFDYQHVESPSVSVETAPAKDTTDVLSDNQHEKSNDSVETPSVRDTNDNLSDGQHVEETTLTESNDDTIQPYLITEPVPVSDTDENTATTEQAPTTSEVEISPNSDTLIKTIESIIEKQVESTTPEIETTAQQTEQDLNILDQDPQIVKEPKDELSTTINIVNNEEDFVIVNDKEWTE